MCGRYTMTGRLRTAATVIAIFLFILPPSDGTKPCLDNWTEFEGHCYRFIRDELSAMTALAFCNKQGGELVDVKSDQENDFLNTISSHPKDPMWIGINNLLEESQFVYTRTGEHIPYQNWAKGQPKGGNSCVAMKDRLWFQYECREEHRFVCKMQYKLLTVLEL